MSCGNTDKFERRVSGTAWAERTELFEGNNEDDWIDIYDEEINDWDNTDEVESIACYDCGMEDTEGGLSEEGILRMRWLHEDENGDWSIEELPEDRRNDELKELIIAKEV